MIFQSETAKRKAVKKVQIAIDKMVWLQDEGVTFTAIERTLDQLRSLENNIEGCPVKPDSRIRIR